MANRYIRLYDTINGVAVTFIIVSLRNMYIHFCNHFDVVCVCVCVKHVPTLVIRSV